MSNLAPSTYDRLGGPATIAEIVDELYDRAGADQELAPYFHSTNMVDQRRRLAEMIGEALGGPAAPWLLGLREAHTGRGVTHRHFSLMAAHLIDILLDRDVDPDETNEMMNWIAAGRDAVVEDPNF